MAKSKKEPWYYPIIRPSNYITSYNVIVNSVKLNCPIMENDLLALGLVSTDGGKTYKSSEYDFVRNEPRTFKLKICGALTTTYNKFVSVHDVEYDVPFTMSVKDFVDAVCKGKVEDGYITCDFIVKNLVSGFKLGLVK